MKRIITSALSALFVAVLVGLTGCEGGGGVDPGIPANTAAPTGAADKMKDMGNMMKDTPPGKAGITPTPAKPADTPPAPEKKD
jgi:hypothetical protein